MPQPPPPPPQAPQAPILAVPTVLTAQDRKRQILERRAASKRSRRSSQSNDTTNGPRSVFDIPTPTTTTQSRSRSVTTTGGDSSSRRSLFAVDGFSDVSATTSNNRNQKRGDGDARRGGIKSSSSLFGAVMQRSQNTTTTSTTATSLKSSLPLPPSPSASPSLARLLDTIGSSFHHMDDGDNHIDATENSQSNLSNLSVNEWRDVAVDTGIVDWSLKRRVRLECFPSDCPPWKSPGWNKALAYYRHPAVHPLPAQLSAPQWGDEAVFSSSLPAAAQALQRRIRQRSSTTALHFWEERRSLWQKAFRELFFVFLKKLRDRKEAWRILYFYCLVHPSQTVLFRANEEHEPTVILSSTSQWQRQYLESRGVLSSENDHDDEKKESDYQSDLHHLRQHAAHNIPGAEINVSLAPTTKKQATFRSGKLTLKGTEGCFAVFEMLLNRPHSSNNGVAWGGCDDVPLLLTRLEGCMYFTTSQVAIGQKWDSQTCSSLTQESQQQQQHCGIELRGFILPCAIRQLLFVTAEALRKHEVRQQHQESSRNDRIKQVSSEEGVGSHYFVAHVQHYEANESSSKSQGVFRGTGSSAAFNDGVNGCEESEVVSMVVWDVVREGSFAFKTDVVVYNKI